MLGFVSAILPDHDLAGVFEVAARLNYDCVELMCWPPAGGERRRYAGTAHVQAEGFSKADAAEVLKLAADHGVTIGGLGYYPNPLDPDADAARTAVAHLERVIDAAALLEVSVVNTFVGRDPAKRVEENWPRFLEVFAPLVARAAERGVNLAIENCPMSFGKDEWPGGKNLAYSPAIWRRMFEDLPDDCFGLNYDPSHLMFMGLDPYAPIQQFGDRIHHAHAKDVRIDRAARQEFAPLEDPERYHTPKLPGFGEMNWGRFAGLLYEVGYRGPVAVEVEDRAFEGSDADVELALKISRDVLRPFWPR
ncbi:sugar phosphate isomerase/epimerase family protein [Alienimonas californiensis]|uniref:Inosose dehydratase n=1 Tax=Alienimonas californiensis TaxID=2527989 RepID=A0A517P6V9_9PLAN|nr:sugar phosphate isomerase/epimerase [Alienimonas californiensis]QDT15117.1 Inosose dehydratase [Alienimonas californiensis]